MPVSRKEAATAIARLMLAGPDDWHEMHDLWRDSSAWTSDLLPIMHGWASSGWVDTEEDRAHGRPRLRWKLRPEGLDHMRQLAALDGSRGPGS